MQFTEILLIFKTKVFSIPFISFVNALTKQGNSFSVMQEITSL